MRECPRCERCLEDEVELCPEDQAKTKHTLPGTTLLHGRYRLEKRLGRGAMGQVYVARDENLVTRRVAVKTIRPDVLSDEDLQEGEAIARFEREARTAASIQHPNVITLLTLARAKKVFSFSSWNSSTANRSFTCCVVRERLPCNVLTDFSNRFVPESKPHMTKASCIAI